MDAGLLPILQANKIGRRNGPGLDSRTASTKVSTWTG